jgi:monoamine oxidase
VIRVTLRFRSRFWDTICPDKNNGKTLSLMNYLFTQDDWFPTWWTRMPDKMPIVTGWAPAHSAERLSRKSQPFVVERALRSLASALKIRQSRLESLLDGAFFHDWQNDPFSRGAYSYGAVGSDGAQADLASPLENTLFFAGEATDTTGHNGTVHGQLQADIMPLHRYCAVCGRRFTGECRGLTGRQFNRDHETFAEEQTQAKAD